MDQDVAMLGSGVPEMENRWVFGAPPDNLTRPEGARSESWRPLRSAIVCHAP